MTKDIEETEQTTDTEEIILYGAQDAEGRVYLVDDPTRLPGDAAHVAEFRVAPDRVAWAILQVQVQELRGAVVSIHVGGCRYATDAASCRTEDQTDERTQQ